MLVITRRPGESIVIDTPKGRVKITFTRFHSSNQVVLSLDAPRCIPIFRGELSKTRLDVPESPG